jgi:hypothetical protein
LLPSRSLYPLQYSRTDERKTRVTGEYKLAKAQLHAIALSIDSVRQVFLSPWALSHANAWCVRARGRRGVAMSVILDIAVKLTVSPACIAQRLSYDHTNNRLPCVFQEQHSPIWEAFLAQYESSREADKALVVWVQEGRHLSGSGSWLTLQAT